jgi:DNA ligase D-like protein (predicted ligase)
MLAIPAAEPFDSENHYFEPKLDGVRALAFIGEGKTRLQARNLADISFQFPELLELHHQVKGRGIVLDGEIVCLDENGLPSFEAIQSRVHKSHPIDVKVASKKQPATYMVFDIIYLEAKPLMNQPLSQRKELLGNILQPSPQVQLVKFVEKEGIALYQAAQAHNLEGVMAKEKHSPYLPGKRSPSWQKFKTKKEGTFVIGGITYGEGIRQDTFGALILGSWGEDGKLHHVGNVGTGFSDYHLREILKHCQALKIDDNPFTNFAPQEKVRL